MPVVLISNLTAICIKDKGIAHLLAGHGGIELTVWVVAVDARLWPYAIRFHMEVMVIFLHPTGTEVFVLEIGAVAPWVANQVGLTVTPIAKGKVGTIIVTSVMCQ
jgi:hypothetical protein